MTDEAYYCALSHEGVLAVRGADADSFLQGQLTCNLKYLSDGRSSLGARCTPKGRMQSSFRILTENAGYLLALSADLLASQLADLSRYAVFSKSKLTDESDHWLRFGLNKGDALLDSLGLALPPEANAVARHEGMMAVRLPDGRAELWVPSAQSATLRAALANALPEAPLNQWLLAQIRAGIGQVFGSTREMFIPQMINLQAVDGVSFKKGCYTGQEIVARMQFLGKLKRRMYRLEGQGGELPAPGVELFSPVHRTSVGEVVLAANAEHSTELLAVLLEDAVADGRILLGSPDGFPLTLLDLPYTLDAQRETQR
ncbi:CAF17-like 4Fe-4S cluster assembly/insertion protein YgfZ [Stutzerimonas tarimensis]|uniref:YgfZ/GcvT domain-containing protein n=1 Tax=Stutzerimonas tarimensis TaxID=1507735 RepID=A0ABV7T827_9GAMM